LETKLQNRNRVVLSVFALGLGVGFGMFSTSGVRVNVFEVWLGERFDKLLVPF
jgi:hypothetical protein